MLANFFRNVFGASLQRKLLLVTTTVMTLFMLGFGLYLVRTQTQADSAKLEERARRTVELLAETTALPLWNIDKNALEAQLNAVLADPEVYAVSIYEADQTEPLVSISREATAVDPIIEKAEITFQNAETSVSIGTVEIIYTRELLYQSLRRTQHLIGASLLALVIFLTLSISIALNNLVVRNVRELTHLTSQVAKGDYTSRANIRTQDEMGLLGQSFNEMTEQLQQLVNNLEQRVAERTEQLAARTLELERTSRNLDRRVGQMNAISTITRSISGIHNLNDLLPHVARLISEQLGYEHTGVFLLDETGEYAVLQAASSEGGKRMLARGHRLKVGQEGIVGYVAASGDARIALSTDADAVFQDNPDLPDTRSEMALPIKVGTEMIGVLDIQSAALNAFSNEDVLTMKTLSDQIAIAIQNARLFQQTQTALEELEQSQKRLLRAGWQQMLRRRSQIGYQLSMAGIAPLERPIERPEIQRAVKTGTPLVEASDHEKKSSLAVPIKLRGDVIGVLNIRTQGNHIWSQDEIDIMQAAAERLALAVENARLVDETALRSEQDRILADLTAKLGSYMQMDSILATAADEISRLVRDTEVLIQIQPISTSDKNSL